jgi:hypothetical protein
MSDRKLISPTGKLLSRKPSSNATAKQCSERYKGSRLSFSNGFDGYPQTATGELNKRP